MKDKKEKDANPISDEEIEKAFKAISDEAEEILKAEEDELEEEEESTEEEEVAEEDLDDEEETEEEEEEVEKAKKKKFNFEKKEEDEDEGEEDEDEEDEDEEEEKPKKKMKKANEDEIGSFSKNPAISKGIEVSDFLGQLVGDIEKAETRTMKVLGNMAILIKGMSDQISSLTEKLESQPRPQKSRIKPSEITEKFEKGGEDEISGVKTLHIKENYREIVQLLDVKTFGVNGDSMNVEFSKALTSYESTKTLPKDIVNRILAEDKVRIVA